ncbi:hypothetical protein GCM10009765_80320 [Fodinicola feengrottensis]|uniref:Helix-turn-helix domain-containing protein n=1 Tax=Fodinicola feengrottensis TaxID=435914 RepID=A0ABN2J869_9ACTN
MSAEDREWLTRTVRTGVHPAQEVRRSRILLELDEGVGEPPGRRAVAEKVGVDPQTIANVAREYVKHEGDVGVTIRRKKQSTPPVEPIVTGGACHDFCVSRR